MTDKWGTSWSVSLSAFENTTRLAMLTVGRGHSDRRAVAVCSHASVTNEDDEPWLMDMAWAVPQFSKQQVNKAGEILVREDPDFSDLAPDDRVNAEDAAWFEYFEALDVINNWRSSHNFPLNTFQNGLRKKGKQIDAHCLIAQRIKRLSSIELKLRRFGTMTLSQMQDIGGCRAIVSSVDRVRALCKLYAESEMKHKLHHMDDYLNHPKESGYRGVHLIYRYHSDRKTEYGLHPVWMTPA
jgi:hypothetical protein